MVTVLHNPLYVSMELIESWAQNSYNSELRDVTLLSLLTDDGDPILLYRGVPRIVKPQLALTSWSPSSAEASLWGPVLITQKILLGRILLILVIDGILEFVVHQPGAPMRYPKES
jgi:hypothetical protein